MIFVPGTTETDPKKQNISLQQIGAATETLQASTATNTANIATNTSNIASNTSSISALQAGPLVSGSVATQSDQETATSTTLAVTPGRQQFHPSAAKAWVKFTGSAVNGAQTVNASYNVSGVSRTGTGAYTVSFTVPFSSANYAAIANGSLAAVVMTNQIAAASQVAGSIGLVFANSSTAALIDPNTGFLAVFGDI